MLNTFLIKLKPYLFVFVLIISISNVNAQCAGQDNTVTVPSCEKEQNPALQNYNLFAQLSGNPQAGGTWSSDNPIYQNALNSDSGIVNLWEINQFGSHSFTYTNNNCNESATVTLGLSGYPGEDNTDGSANACSSNIAVNLFSFLNNNNNNNNNNDLNPDINGVWRQIPDNDSGYLSGKFFDAAAAGPGTYTFTYTVSSVDNCPSRFSTVILEVHRDPFPGSGTKIKICASEDFSQFTGLNLFNFIGDGFDTNGIWSETSGTNQIDDNLDSTINLQEIFNNFGIGEYAFEYSVSPDHGVCSINTSEVLFSIVDISGEFSVENICNSDPLTISINHTNSNNDEFSYTLEYEIKNSTTEDVVFTSSKDISTLQNGSINNNTSIELPENTIINAGNYTISAKAITNFDGVICDSFQVTEASFTVFGPRLSTAQLCFNGSNADISIDNLVDDNGVLVTDTFSINYTIEDKVNNTTRNIQNQEITFTNGSAILPVDISSFPENAIDYNLRIENAINKGLECINFDFSADLIPENITLDFLEGGSCNAKTLEAVINAPPISNGSYTINYTITNQETSEIVASNPISLISGVTNYNIDVTNLPANNYTITLNSTQNDTNQCRTQFDFTNTTNFTISPPIPLPVLDTNQTFCINSSTTIFEPKISDIVVTSGENLIWYESFNSETPINENTILVDGEDYYVTSSNPEVNCINSDRVPVFVQLVRPSLLTSDNTNPVFCSIDNPNLANLSINENSNNILWYNSATGGDPLDLSTPLVNGQSYYAVENINGCEFDTRLEFNVTINTIPAVPVLDINQSFCINSTLIEPKISDIIVTSGENLIWYESLNSETPIDENTILIDGEDYYVTSSSLGENCVNTDRVPVVVQLIRPSLLTSNDTSPIFCNTDNSNLANLSINENSNNILWYDAPTGGNILNLSTPIVNGQSYYAVENINGCEFDTRLEFTPTTLDSMIPEYTGSNLLCALDNLTLEDLEADITKDDAFELIWYDAAIAGNQIDNSETVQENVEYYVAGVSGSCETERLLISVSLSNCDPNSFDFFIPDGFSPNNDGRNDTYHIPNIMFTFPDYELEIFNRYGQSIAKLNKDNPEWNGENSKTGKVTTSGVYFYILNYNSNNLEPKQGRIYLSK